MTQYQGTELELFAGAVRWKRYWRSRISDLVRGRVLDVGAGIGSTLELFQDASSIRQWTALEPDESLAAMIRPASALSLQVICGYLEDADGEYDTILYIDVLEHIADDNQELQEAASRLAPGGRLIVLAPAHGWLYSDYDQAIGHYRRYNREMLTALSPAGVTLDRIEYLDLVGMLASLANRWMLHQAAPGLLQVQTWDRLMVPVSRILDPLLGYRFGKSILAIWSRPDN